MAPTRPSRGAKNRAPSSATIEKVKGKVSKAKHPASARDALLPVRSSLRRALNESRLLAIAAKSSHDQDTSVTHDHRAESSTNTADTDHTNTTDTMISTSLKAQIQQDSPVEKTASSVYKASAHPFRLGQRSSMRQALRASLGIGVDGTSDKLRSSYSGDFDPFQLSVYAEPDQVPQSSSSVASKLPVSSDTLESLPTPLDADTLPLSSISGSRAADHPALTDNLDATHIAGPEDSQSLGHAEPTAVAKNTGSGRTDYPVSSDGLDYSHSSTPSDSVPISQSSGLGAIELPVAHGELEPPHSSVQPDILSVPNNLGSGVGDLELNDLSISSVELDPPHLRDWVPYLPEESAPFGLFDVPDVPSSTTDYGFLIHPDDIVPVRETPNYPAFGDWSASSDYRPPDLVGHEDLHDVQAETPENVSSSNGSSSESLELSAADKPSNPPRRSARLSARLQALADLASVAAPMAVPDENENAVVQAVEEGIDAMDIDEEATTSLTSSFSSVGASRMSTATSSATPTPAQQQTETTNRGGWWAIKEVVLESSDGRFLVDWVGFQPGTDIPWPSTWVYPKDLTAAAKNEWKEKKEAEAKAGAK